MKRESETPLISFTVYGQSDEEDGRWIGPITDPDAIYALNHLLREGQDYSISVFAKNAQGGDIPANFSSEIPFVEGPEPFEDGEFHFEYLYIGGIGTDHPYFWTGWETFPNMVRAIVSIWEGEYDSEGLNR